LGENRFRNCIFYCVVPFTLPLCHTVIFYFPPHCTFRNPCIAHVDISAGCCLFRKLVHQLVPVVSSMCHYCIQWD
jgi:hypothetical protein